MPPITLHFLQASRCIRTAWQLSELGLDYNVKFANRENGVAPAQFKKEAGGLGKFPTLDDGDLRLYESTNIAEYISDKYDTEHRLLPAVGDPQRYQVLQWVHASEGTYALHALAVLYVKWFQKDGSVEKTVEGVGANVLKDLDHLDAELGKSGGRFLLGDRLTLADITMQFTAQFILARELGTQGRHWANIEKWLKSCEEVKSYQAAVAKTGHKL